jgi:hypothetical protein
MKYRPSKWSKLLSFRNSYLALLTTLALLIQYSASAQVDTNRVRQQINAYGYSYKNIGIDSSLRIPRDTFRLKLSDTGSVATRGGVFYIWSRINGLLKWYPIQGGGGGATDPDLIQSHTSGTSITVGAGTNTILVNPASRLATLSITLPSTAHSSGIVSIFFGGTMTTGEVVGTLTLIAPGGSTILQASQPVEVQAGESIVFKKISSVWRRIY